MDEPTHAQVFISYSHDSPQHQRRVRRLADRLIRDGVNCEIDLDEPNPPDGWWAWMERKLAEADFVLVACTDGYYQKATARREASGHGVKFESVLLIQALYGAAMWNERFIPVLFEDLPESRILAPLRQFTRYRVDRQADYTKLLRHLTRQPERIRPPLGPVPVLPPEADEDLGPAAPIAEGAAQRRPKRDHASAGESRVESAPRPLLQRLSGLLGSWPGALVREPRRRHLIYRTAGALLLLAGAVQRGDRKEMPKPSKAAPPRAAQSQRAGPRTPDELYAEGVKLWQQLDLRRSRRLFEEAIARRPGDWLASSALMMVLHELDSDKDPEALRVKGACDHAGDLQPREGLLVTARCSLVEHQWDEAIDAYQALARSSPDCLECGLGLVRALLGAEHFDEALKEVERLQRRPALDPAAARLCIAEAEVAGQRSDYAARYNKAAARAAYLADRQGAPWIAARAWHLQGTALVNEPDRALTLLADAEDFYRLADDRLNLATVIGDRANQLKQRGRVDEAKERSEEALKIFKKLGGGALALLGQDRQQFLIAGIDLERGKIDEAESLFTEAISKYRVAGNRPEEARAESNAGVYLDRQGKRKEAMKYYEDALNHFHALGDPGSEAAQLNSLAEDDLEALNLDAAEGHLSRAKRLVTETGNEEVRADVLWIEGDVAAARGLSDVAMRTYSEAQVLTRIRNPPSAALIGLSIASLDLDRGRPTAAKAEAGRALEQFQGQQQESDRAQAEAVLVLALVASGSFHDAEREIEKAEKLRDRSQDHEVRVAVAVAGSRLRAAAGQPGQALRDLDGALRAAQDAGLGRRALDVQLAMGEIEIEAAHGDRKHAARVLAALEDEARKHGFVAVAKRAARSRAAAGAR